MYFDSSIQFFKKWNELTSRQEVKISEMMIHSFAALYISFIEEILVHSPNSEELDAYINQMAVFVYAGTTKIMKIN